MDREQINSNTPDPQEQSVNDTASHAAESSKMEEQFGFYAENLFGETASGGNAVNNPERSAQSPVEPAKDPTVDPVTDLGQALNGAQESGTPSARENPPHDTPLDRAPLHRTSGTFKHPEAEMSENGKMKKSNKRLKIALAVIATALILSIILSIGLVIVAAAAFFARLSILDDPTPSLPPQQQTTTEVNLGNPPPPSSYNVDDWINTGALDNPNAMVQAVAKCLPSVVAITVKSSAGEGAGSGVIWSSDGYIVTNNHVVEGASSITVMLANGSKYPATCVATDAQNDLALVRINVTGLLPVSTGSSNDLAVGETVIAIGNPLGTLTNTVTDGILSALARDISIEGVEMNLMQISAAINPGNSGGGCFDINGDLIGIVNAKTAASGIEGLGFAIPIDTVKTVIAGMIENDTSTLRKSFGITGCYEINEENYDDFRQNNLIRRVEELNGGPLYGIYIASDGQVDYVDNENTFAAWDVIRTVNGVEIKTMDDINALLETVKTGEELTVTVTRLVSVSYGFMQSRYSLEENTIKIRVVEMYR